jgi:GTPase
MKTTVFGLSSYAPDFSMLLISANTGIVGTTKEHLGFSLALEVPVFIVVNKTDLCHEKLLQQTLNSIQTLLKSPGVNRMPLVISNDDDAVVAVQNFTESKYVSFFSNFLFFISSIH